jgi:hypothetical protein
MLLWEDVLPGDIRRSALEDLVFQLKLPRPAAQLSSFFSVLVSLTGLPFSSASACAIQFRRHDSLMPRSLAI